MTAPAAVAAWAPALARPSLTPLENPVSTSRVPLLRGGERRPCAERYGPGGGERRQGHGESEPRRQDAPGLPLAVRIHRGVLMDPELGGCWPSVSRQPSASARANASWLAEQRHRDTIALAGREIGGKKARLHLAPGRIVVVIP